VVVIDDLRTGRAEFVGDHVLHRCDVGNAKAVDEVFRSDGPFSGVLHFAASTSVPASVADPLGYYANNTVASQRLLEVSIQHGVGSFVLSSTAAVYGNPKRVPVQEDSELAPINPYGASKWFFERILSDAALAHGMAWCALRYFNAAGADRSGELGDGRFPASHLIPAALEAACGLRPALELFGDDYPTQDGTCVRDYIHVTDLASAHVLAVEQLIEGAPSGCFNLGTGRGFSNREVIEAVHRVTGMDVPLEARGRRAGDPAELVADAGRFQEAYGWRAEHSDLDEIVGTAWNWMKRERKL